jgi:hypothetical protein
MMEDVPTLLGQVVSVPLTKAFQRMNSGFSFIGRSLEQRNYVDIAKELDCDLVTTICFNADFSKHDNYVDEYQMCVAFGVLRLCFPENWKFMDKLFYYNLSSMVCKNVVLPGSGFIYRIFKGIATGHPFTSLVNTISAYATFATAIYKTCDYGEISKTRLFVAGDDIIGIVPLSALAKISHEMSVNSGMKISPITETSGPLYSNNPKYHISFLKKKFLPHGVAWNDYELIENLKFSTNGYKNSQAEITRIINMLMNGPSDFLLNSLVLKLINKHMEAPRIRGISAFIFKGISVSDFPPYIRGSPYYNRDGSSIYTPAYKRSIRQRFNSYMNLAHRWFNAGQPFLALGSKDDAYWIDANKIVVPPVNRPFRYLLRGLVRERFGVKWLI